MNLKTAQTLKKKKLLSFLLSCVNKTAPIQVTNTYLTKNLDKTLASSSRM